MLVLCRRWTLPATLDHSPARLHLHVQPSLHTTHLHVLMQVPVHVALSRGQLHLEQKGEQGLENQRDGQQIKEKGTTGTGASR